MANIPEMMMIVIGIWCQNMHPNRVYASSECGHVTYLLAAGIAISLHLVFILCDIAFGGGGVVCLLVVGSSLFWFWCDVVGVL